MRPDNWILRGLSSAGVVRLRMTAERAPAFWPTPVCGEWHSAPTANSSPPATPTGPSMSGRGRSRGRFQLSPCANWKVRGWGSGTRRTSSATIVIASLTFYDAFFLSLPVELDCPFVTADQRLFDHTLTLPCVRHLSRVGPIT